MRQVLHSRLVTHDQLFEFMRIGCYELKRSSFNWRVRRLVDSGFLNRRRLAGGAAYSIGSAGASLLAVTEDYCPTAERERPTDAPAMCDHSLELNELHLSLARQGVLEEWIPETVIRSRNELTVAGYAKDYDAIVTVWLEGRKVSFALEYERTPKKPSDYGRIRDLLEQEYRLDRFLYVVPNAELASFVLHCFAGTSVRLLIGLASAFRRSFKEMPVIDAASGATKPAITVL